jgi:hypothetical protein
MAVRLGTPLAGLWSDRLSENAHQTIAPPRIRQNKKPAEKAVRAIAILDMRRKPVIGGEWSITRAHMEAQ